jgi:16S rRNA (uracil1498-N3)-methyltransferase
MQPPRRLRLYVDELPADTSLELVGDRAHYLRNVLRVKTSQTIIVFDARGYEALADVVRLTRHGALLQVSRQLEPLAESPLEVHLIQSVAKSDAMDLIVQKATELGIARIRPVITEHSVVRLDAERAGRRLEHWQRIARSACEQSGRHYLPTIDPPCPLAEALADNAAPALQLLLDPGAERSLARRLAGTRLRACQLLVGPEGGFSRQDLASARRAGFEGSSLGPRVLRVETAAISACALAQGQLGDLR